MASSTVSSPVHRSVAVRTKGAGAAPPLLRRLTCGDIVPSPRGPLAASCFDAAGLSPGDRPRPPPHLRRCRRGRVVLACSLDSRRHPGGDFAAGTDSRGAARRASLRAAGQATSPLPSRARPGPPRAASPPADRRLACDPARVIRSQDWGRPHRHTQSAGTALGARTGDTGATPPPGPARASSSRRLGSIGASPGRGRTRPRTPHAGSRHTRPRDGAAHRGIHDCSCGSRLPGTAPLED